MAANLFYLTMSFYYFFVFAMLAIVAVIAANPSLVAGILIITLGRSSARERR